MPESGLPRFYANSRLNLIDFFLRSDLLASGGNETVGSSFDKPKKRKARSIPTSKTSRTTRVSSHPPTERVMFLEVGCRK
jgi:hypothetical protein